MPNGEVLCGCAGPEGSYINLTSDPANCGSCGHNCMGAACTNSLCGPLPVELAATTNPAAIAVYAANAYWTSSSTQTTGASAGSVNSIPIAGGTATALATGRNAPTSRRRCHNRLLGRRRKRGRCVGEQGAHRWRRRYHPRVGTE